MNEEDVGTGLGMGPVRTKRSAEYLQPLLWMLVCMDFSNDFELSRLFGILKGQHCLFVLPPASPPILNMVILPSLYVASRVFPMFSCPVPFVHPSHSGCSSRTCP